MSGITKRIRQAIRLEVSELADADSDELDPITFVSALVANEYTDKTKNKHLVHVSWEDPVAHRMTVMKAKAVFDDWMTVKDRDQAEEDNEEKMPKLQEAFEALNAKYWLTQALIGEKIFGNSALILSRDRLQFDDGTVEVGPIKSLNVFTPENSDILDTDFDKEGNPTFLTVYPNARNRGLTRKIPFKDIIWFNTRPRSNSWYGYSALFPIWADLTYMRHSKHNIGWLYQKMGQGWMVFYNRDLTEEEGEQLEENLKKMTSSRAMMVDVNMTEKVEWLGPSASSTAGVVDGINMFLGQISSGSGVPKSIFTGDNSGAITGGEMNDKAWYGEVKSDQFSINVYVRALAKEMGFSLDGKVISWNVRYANDGLEEAQIRELNARAAQMELNIEMQEKEGKRPNDFQIGFGSAKDETKNKNPAGVG